MKERNYRQLDGEAILQIIPAHNIVARFSEDGQNNDHAVVCWALVETYGDIDNPSDRSRYQTVRGMVLLSGSTYLDCVGSRSEEGTGQFVGYFETR